MTLGRFILIVAMTVMVAVGGNYGWQAWKEKEQIEKLTPIMTKATILLTDTVAQLDNKISFSDAIKLLSKRTEEINSLNIDILAFPSAPNAYIHKTALDYTNAELAYLRSVSRLIERLFRYKSISDSLDNYTSDDGLETSYGRQRAIKAYESAKEAETEYKEAMDEVTASKKKLINAADSAAKHYPSQSVIRKDVLENVLSGS